MATELGHDPMSFRPPRRRRGLQLAIGLPLTVVALVPTLYAAWLVWSPHVVKLAVGDGRLDITTGPSLLGGHRRVDLEAISSVEEVRLEGGRRVNGTALPGYCVGHFRYSNLGTVWQATDCSGDALLLRLGAGEPIVLTPPDRESFVAAFASGGSYVGEQPTPSTGAGWAAIKILIALLPLLGIVVPLVFFVAPNRLRYRVEPGELVVTTILGSRRFATRGAAVRPHRPQVGLRLWGTGAPGYYTGLFRVDGENTRVYATSVERGVLIEGDGLRIFVNPENETPFLEAMQTLGGTH